MKTMANLVLALTILISASAQADVGQGLKEAFNEYHYSMTVEWDQKDSSQKQNFEKVLSDRLAELRHQGMVKEDLLTFLESQPQGKILGKNLRARLTLIDLNLMSKDEALNIYNEIASSTYQSGASWNGIGTGMTIMFVVIGALALTTLGLWAAGEVDCNQERRCYVDSRDCDSLTVCK